MKTRTLLTFTAAICTLLCSCSNNTSYEVSVSTDTETEYTAAVSSEETEITAAQDITDSYEPEGILKASPEYFPVTDGSTSAASLDAAIKAAYLGGFTADELKPFIIHSGTYNSFRNLISRRVDAVYTVEISDEQRKNAENENFHIESIPVAKEAFVFIVNESNPVKSLSQQQLKDIFTGKITNWSEVGGNDAEIKVYLRNHDSGSSNYLTEFLGDSEPVSGERVYFSGSMGGITDMVASYEDGADSIGISVYSYVSQIAYEERKPAMLAVDGTAPDNSSLADDTYPLMSYTYFIYSADLPEDSEVRKLAEFIKTPEAQNAVEECGYIRAYN